MTEDRPSRSQKKRDSAALQKLGEELAALPETILAAFPLSAKTREAMREWRRVSSREGKRRQMQYIGRLMREETDIPALRKALAAHAAGGADDARALLQAERLRAALMEADPEETERLLRPFSTAESALDTAAADPARELLDLVRKARNEREHGRPPHAFRALFRRLRDISLSPHITNRRMGPDFHAGTQPRFGGPDDEYARGTGRLPAASDRFFA